MSSVTPEPNLPPQAPRTHTLSEKFAPIKSLYEAISEEIGKLFVGQDELVLGTLTALFAGGHVLIESVPGLGKTLFVRTLGQVLGLSLIHISEPTRPY